MTKLTNAVRGQILTQLLKRAFLDRLTKQQADEAAFAEEIYLDVYGKELPLLKDIPAKWFDTSNSIQVEIAGAHVRLDFTNGYRTSSDFAEINMAAFQKQISKRVPHASGWATIARYDARSKFDRKWMVLVDARGLLKAEYSQARNQAKAILDSTSTVKRLIEIWPEIKEFAESYLVDTPKQTALPVVQFDALNRILDLPPETKAA